MACEYVCPECRSPLAESGQGFACASCGREYPILFGIPDFRLQGDCYLTLAAEREKAAKLYEFGRSHDFTALVSHYYSITDDVPAHLVPIFSGYLLNAELRSRPALCALAPSGGRHLLDLGCGGGGALIEGSARFAEITGVDIALRWLVIAQKRLQEAGITARLVCADAASLPFANGRFSHIMASDLLENTRSPTAVIQQCGAMLERAGRLYISSANGNWPGPHPATGVWAAGLLPAERRSSALRRKHGVDLLRAVSLVRPNMIRQAAASAGLKQLDARPLELEPQSTSGRAALFRWCARLYRAFTRLPLLRTVLLHVGPVFQATFLKEQAT